MNTTAQMRECADDLRDKIDALEAAFAPILKAGISGSASKLPLMDQAQLYTLTTYAIESLLFSAIRLDGSEDAKKHPVFQELNRVKGYFAKIKAAQTTAEGKRSRVDVEAVDRMIKHGTESVKKLQHGPPMRERKRKRAEGKDEVNKKQK
ncbi:hypothetical protein K470DRAFT_256887 [Piedraia hortae CBS 480.64]|uniref:Exosome complex protein n=1 Tax=Piedraia hortae CBS 480.64 TaxID=1314780 RepID=A0A6A7C217_9PEZI|nr:hypothetical protein K470DRAFT_256887 [Piedraia hortae CBS 480.64]